MPVTFILGRAGTGKTRWCLDALAAELEKTGGTRRLLLIVPEQASFEMERAVALGAPRNGFWRAEVLSFSRLARRIFDEAGCEPSTLRASARVLALRCVAQCEPAALRAFGPSANTAGFFSHLDRLIEELISENVSAQQFFQAAAGLDDAGQRRRAEGLARVYKSYLGWLGSERIDPAGRLSLLDEALAGVDWLSDTLVWVAGFAGVTGQELEALVALARRAGDVFVTMLLDPAAPLVRDARVLPDVLNLFQRTETTFQRLRKRLADEGVEQREPVLLQPAAPPRFAEAPDLVCLESGLATPIGAVSVADAGGAGLRARSRDQLAATEGRPTNAPTTPTPVSVLRRADEWSESRSASASVSIGVGEAPSSTQVRIVECETHRDELRAAARFIRQKVVESAGALRFRDFALIARDLEPFAHDVRDVFADYGIPLFVDRRRPLGAHAVARFVPALLEAAAADCSVPTMIRLLRGGLTPLTREQAEALDRQVTTNEIRGLDAWSRRRWETKSGGDGALDRARLRFVEAIAPLVRLAREGAAAGANLAEAIHTALVDLQVPEKLASWIEDAKQAGDWETAEVHRLAWDALCETLEDLHDVLGDRPIEISEAAAIIDAALGEQSVGLAPPTLDQVLVGSIERSRHPDVKYVWVFGVNDGLFPAPPRAETLLSVGEREALAAAGAPALRPHRDDAYAERMLAYIALTRGSLGLTVSYARVDNAGEAAYPSPIVSDVRRAIPGLTIEKPEESEPPACLGEAAGGFLRARLGRRAEPALWRRYQRLHDELRAATSIAPEFEEMLRGLRYDNLAAPAPGYTGKGQPPAKVVWSGSPSELETHLQCPFKHFARYRLSLDTRRGPTPTAQEQGSLAHEILAAVVRKAIDLRKPPCEIDDEQWLGWLNEALKPLGESESDRARTQRPQASFLRRALQPFVREVVLAHASRWRRGEFEPLDVEKHFECGGDSGALDALEIEVGEGRRARLLGFLDRIDRRRRDDGVDLIVYDYKTSPGGVRKSFLTRDRLQLFTYLLAVEQALARGDNTRVVGVFLAPLFPDYKTSGNKYFAEAPEEDARMYLYRPRGLFDLDVAKALDAQLGTSRSPVAAMQLKKDGEFYATSDAKPAGELRAFLDLARRTIEHVVTGLAGGAIDIAPLIEGRTLACRRCDFAPLCRFETAFNRPRVAETTLPNLTAASAESGGE